MFHQKRYAELDAMLMRHARLRATVERITPLPDTIDISEAPTQITDAIKPVKLAASFEVLPLDSQGRPFLLTYNDYEDTLILVESLVEHYRKIRGVYPSAVLLSAFRYLTRGKRPAHFYPKAAFMK
jgi:hypothetical protein